MADARTVIADILTGYMPRGRGVHDEAADDVLTALTAAGLLVTPEHDASVRKAALEEAAAVCRATADELQRPSHMPPSPAFIACLDCRTRIRTLLAAALLLLGARHGPVPVQHGWPVVPIVKQGV